MPSPVALLAIFGCVLYLLHLERKQSREVSSASWVPTIWMLACASKPLACWFGANQEAEGADAEAGSASDRALLIILIFAALFILKGRRLDWQAFKRNNGWLVLIYVFAFVSIAWSEFTFISIKRYIRFLGTPLMALVILSEVSPRQALESVLRRMAFILIPLSLLLIKYYPDLGVVYGRWSGQLMWVGVAGQKNSMGMVCYVSAFFLFWVLLRTWQEKEPVRRREMVYAEGLVLLISLYLLKGPPNAYSATSVAVFVLGAATLLGLLWQKKHNKTVSRWLLITVVLVLFGYGFGAPFGLRKLGAGFLQMLGRDASFTDRDQIWQELVSIASQNPVLGLGYGGFWVRPIESGVNEAHNGYLGVMLEMGLVGILLLLAAVVSMCRAAHALLSRQFWWAALAYCFLLIIVVHNTTEASFLRTSDFLWTLMVFLMVQLKLPGRATVVQAQPQAMESGRPADASEKNGRTAIAGEPGTFTQGTLSNT